jgi:hypothetical protein
VIFYAIYKNQPLTFTIGVALLQGGPRKELFLRNVVPGSGGQRGVAQFRRGPAGARSGRVGERSRVHWGPVCGVGQGRGGAGERPTGIQWLRLPRLAKPARGPRVVAWVGRRAVEGLEDCAGDPWVALGLAEEGCSRGERPGSCGGRRRASASAVVGARPLRANAAGAGGVGWLLRSAHAALAGTPGRGADNGPRGRGDSGTAT